MEKIKDDNEIYNIYRDNNNTHRDDNKIRDICNYHSEYEYPPKSNITQEIYLLSKRLENVLKLEVNICLFFLIQEYYCDGIDNHKKN